MARKKYYLPTEDAKLVVWLQNLSSKISGYAVKYGITPAEVTFIQNAAAYFAFWFNALSQLNGAVQNLARFKSEIANGVKAGGSPSVLPADIIFGTPPTAVPPGILATIRSIVARIKKHQSYTTADGEQLKIEGDENTTDPNTLKPVLEIKLQSGHPNLIWKKGIADGVKIVKAEINPDSTNPQPTLTAEKTDKSLFQFLAIDTQPDYLDTTPLPAFGKSANWAYRMIYLINDEEVGEWSDVVFITVTGSI